MRKQGRAAMRVRKLSGPYDGSSAEQRRREGAPQSTKVVFEPGVTSLQHFSSKVTLL